jgi:hypothetical protein
VDLTYLYKRREASLFMTEHAQSLDVRQIHREFAARYAARMAEFRMSRAHDGAE